jgi:hypothetical protein
MKKPKKLQIILITDNIKNHRYKSIDDWQDPDEIKLYKNGKYIIESLQFNTQVADMDNMDYNFLVLMHAIVEQYLCYKHKITDEQVTKFDKEHTHCDNPGEHEEAPYHSEHVIANDVESMLSVALKIDWNKYEKAIDKTLAKFPKPKKKK